jgi:hypothetical protein
MRTIYLLLCSIVFLLYGCSSSKHLNSAWKKSLAELQITPVMPLRQHLEVGEVYRYFKRPKSYFEDGQIEPPVAFTIKVKNYDSNEQDKRIWPTFTYEGRQKDSLSTSIKSIGVLGANIESEDKISLKVIDGFSKHAELVDIIDAFAKRNCANWEVEGKYKDNVQKLANIRYRMWIGNLLHSFMRFFTGEKESIYLRIPAEVYYAKGIQVSLSKASETSGRLDIDINSMIIKDVTVVYHDKMNIVLTEDFNKPMVIGYKGLLYKVHTESGIIEENLEDLE